MSVKEKTGLFKALAGIGFKEIEVGFPSASETEYTFCREIIDQKLIPEGVAIQSLVQCREHLIRKTFEALSGAPEAIVHFYNSTNPLQRRVTFGLGKEEIKNIAVKAAALVKSLIPTLPDTKLRFQYSPESFSDTELDFSLEICQAVMEVMEPTPENPMILNLPATVEMSTPNIHADQIEWFCNHLKHRDCALISLHTHNDRGTGVAATELGLMAGADRVEGTLFGNGERTGNLDIVTVALNMYTQGVDPGLDFSDLPALRALYEENTRMDVHPRHPYGGDLVFTAFSGSHQDAIKKGMDKMDKSPDALWQVPYLTIDPEDIGRTYKAIIRINAQSGKGGVAYILNREYGFDIPKLMAPEFGAVVTAYADKMSEELTPEQVKEIFYKEYLQRDEPLKLKSYRIESLADDHHKIELNAQVIFNGEDKTITGHGNGPINALSNAIERAGWKQYRLLDYRQHALTGGSDADAATYIQIERATDKQSFWGVSLDGNIEQAGLKALISAFNRARANGEIKDA